MISPRARTAQYQRIDRGAVHRAHRRHPYRHHIERLSAALSALVAELALCDEDRVLDFGCAEMPYRSLFPAAVDYVGADLPGNARAALALQDDGRVPTPDESFNAVLSTQVLEHVHDPALYLSECFRVLVPGGRMLLCTHGVFPYHPDPSDLWRWTCEGLRWSVERAGFEVMRFEGIIGLAASGLQLFQDAASYRLGPRGTPWLALLMQPLIAWVDGFETPESLAYNAQVFAAVARRPG